MTVMLPQFFGVPQHLVRSGLLNCLGPSQLSLYVGLLHDSERYSTHELHRSDADLTKLTGISSRSLRDARIKLQEYGLIQYQLRQGRRCIYVICDPATGKPYPGNPKERIPYRRRGTSASPAPISDQPGEKSHEGTKTGPSPDIGDPARHGVTLDFE